MLARLGSVTGAAAIALTIGLPAAAADGAAVTGYSPAFGPVGSVVHVSGSGLTGADDVTFNGVDAGVPNNATDTGLDIAVPTGATTGPVGVHTPSGMVTGPTFTVQVPTGATITRSVSSVTYPGAVVVSSVLSAGGSGAGGVMATLQGRTPGTAWHSLGTSHATWSSGAVSWTVRPTVVTTYRVVFAATQKYAGTTSAITVVYVHPKLVLQVPGVAPVLTKLRLAGSAHPATSGLVYLDTYASGRWQHVVHTWVNGNGNYAFVMTLRSTGEHRFRVQRPAAGGWLLANGHTVRIYAVKRTLRSGLSGPDVTALQNRLKALHYDVGSVSGRFNYDTLHAVIAFEKVQKLPRDGVVGATVWERLTHPVVPRLLHPYSSGRAIEVDLTRQVLYYAVNGSIARILDASTGGGYYYTGSDGTTQRAITLTGHFHIVYKLTGWHQAKLGYLYDPAYFNNSGYAIHGETEVPSYPASHGCVRITVPAMDRLYSLLSAGMSVWIYRT